MEELSNFLLLFGALECLLLAILFYKYRGCPQKLNRLFSLMLLLIGFEFLISKYLVGRSYQQRPSLLPLDSILTLIQNPLLYIFCLKLCKEKVELNKKTLLIHFGPAVFYVILCLPYWLMGYEGQLRILEEDNLYILLILAMDLVVIPIQFILYFRKMIKTLNQFKIRLKEYYSEIDNKRMVWFKGLLFLLAGLYIFLVISILLEQIFFIHLPEEMVYLPINFFFLCFVQIISYKLLIHPEILLGFEIPEKKQPIAMNSQEISEIQTMASEIEDHVIRTQSFLDPDLSLKDLSDEMGMSLHSVSKAINSHFNKNFFDFINRYRVDYVKDLLNTKRDITILEAAFEGGFNSKSSFNRIFKKQTGQTPSEYRKLQS